MTRAVDGCLVIAKTHYIVKEFIYASKWIGHIMGSEAAIHD